MWFFNAPGIMQSMLMLILHTSLSAATPRAILCFIRRAGVSLWPLSHIHIYIYLSSLTMYEHHSLPGLLTYYHYHLIPSNVSEYILVSNSSCSLKSQLSL